jgi:hypothetical protein
VAAGVSIYNARFGRFTRERWWEQKAEAYRQIVGALTALIDYYRTHHDAAIGEREIPDDRAAEIQATWKEGIAAIRRSTDMGAFLVSSQAAEALRAFWKKSSDDDSNELYYEMVERDYAAAEECLAAVTAAAKADLRVW